MAFTQITVTRSYRTAEAAPAVGTVRFTPTAPMRNGATVIAALVVDALDAVGDLSIAVAANNDPATTPVGTSYLVQERIRGQSERSYYVIIPHDAAGGTVDLSTLTAAEVPPVVTYPIAGPTGPTGAGVAVGGTTGQALVKTSGTDFATGWITLAKGDVGLGSVDNTSDTAKPVSSAQQAALDLKLAKASNLSDLASAATARTNLGLGGAATLAVGTTAGTVMAGNDSRVVALAAAPPLLLIATAAALPPGTPAGVVVVVKA